jgi:hypothetical protein
MRVIIQVNNVGTELSVEFEEPFSCGVHIPPWILHPFELEIALINSESASCRLLLLANAEGRAHRGDRHFNTLFPQTAGQLQGIRPDAAERVRSHEDPAKCTHLEPSMPDRVGQLQFAEW